MHLPTLMLLSLVCFNFGGLGRLSEMLLYCSWPVSCRAMDLAIEPKNLSLSAITGLETLCYITIKIVWTPSFCTVSSRASLNIISIHSACLGLELL